MKQNIFITKSNKETQKIAQEFSSCLINRGVIALFGDLGAGKTTFVQGLAKGLGIKQRIISPTFIIVRSYELNGKLQTANGKTSSQILKLFYHIDLYRTESVKDVLGLGIKEIMNNPENIVVIEWAEKIENLLPKNTIKIYFEYINDTERKLKIVQNPQVELRFHPKGGKYQEAIKVLKQGGIVIFPTDTAFGIGCRIDNEKAVQRLFTIRKRPTTQATLVLVDTVRMAQGYLEPIFQEVIDKLIEPYWPGALTIVLPCKKEKVPSLVRGGENTIGVRIPNHPITRTLIREIGVPILGPSANFHGEQTPYEFEEIDTELIKLVDYLIPKELASPVFGEARSDIRLASTVIDCSEKPWKILREGAIQLSF